MTINLELDEDRALIEPITDPNTAYYNSRKVTDLLGYRTKQTPKRFIVQ